MYYFTVYMPWLARELQKRGFELLDVQPNIHNPKRAVYKFENSGELQHAIFEITKHKKEHK